MKSYFRVNLFAVVLIITPLLFSCHNLIIGKGDVIEQTGFKDSTATIHFTEIEVKSDCNVFLNQDNYTEVKITGYENLVPYVHAYEENNKYIVDLADGYVFDNNNIHIYITTPAYTKITLQSASSIVAADSIISTTIEVVNNGSGTISLFGDATYINAYSASSGLTRLCAMEGDTVNAFMLGSGILSTKPVGKLNAQISGSGQIQYLGNPTLNFSISGSGSLLQTLGCY